MSTIIWLIAACGAVLLGEPIVAGLFVLASVLCDCTWRIERAIREGKR